jgi:ribosomal protein S18 acetylase RimI-like enzyme
MQDSRHITFSLGPFGLSGARRKLRRNLDDYGWRVALGKSLAQLVRLVYVHQTYEIYRIKLDAVRPRTGADQPHLNLKFLTAHDAEAIAQVEDMAEWLRGNLKRRIEAGQLCLVALSGSTVAGFNLISFGEVMLSLVGLKKGIQRRHAWSEHIAVQKKFRKRGLATWIHEVGFDELERRGIRRVYAGVLPSNAASLRLVRSAGFRKLLSIHYRKVLWWEGWRYERARR